MFALLIRGNMIIFQDDDIVVCEKPYGVSSQGSSGENMVDMLKTACRCEIYPVHRLDTQTTGLIVYAKNPQSAAKLSSQVAERKLQKEYLCLCHGEIDESGKMVDFLYHDRIKNKSFAVKTKRNGSKEAILEYQRICEKSVGECRLFLVRVKLYTGRTHQIRVQFASRGYPLYGDGKYGAHDNARIHLHSCSLSFSHPKTGKSISFSSSPSWAQNC